MGWMVSATKVVSCICQVDVMLEKQLWKLRADQTKEERDIIWWRESTSPQIRLDKMGLIQLQVWLNMWGLWMIWNSPSTESSIAARMRSGNGVWPRPIRQTYRSPPRHCWLWAFLEYKTLPHIDFHESCDRRKTWKASPMASNQLKVGLTHSLMKMELEVEIQNRFLARFFWATPCAGSWQVPWPSCRMTSRMLCRIHVGTSMKKSVWPFCCIFLSLGSQRKLQEF